MLYLGRDVFWLYVFISYLFLNEKNVNYNYCSYSKVQNLSDSLFTEIQRIFMLPINKP